MSFAALFENTQKVALAKREEIERQNIQAIAEFEEVGPALAHAFDVQELEQAEEALRLGEKFDEQEDQALNEREEQDLRLALSIFADEKGARRHTPCSAVPRRSYSPARPFLVHSPRTGPASPPSLVALAGNIKAEKQACVEDERLAQALDAQLKKEALRCAELERKVSSPLLQLLFLLHRRRRRPLPPPS